MANRRRLEGIDGEIQLPQPIIQHIQSFLDTKQATRTTVLSKSWYNAWSSRPNLDFDDQHFEDRGFDVFRDTVKKTIERYEKLNLKIESLRLWMTLVRCSSELYSFACEVVHKAIRMNVEHIDLSGPSPDFVCPFEVLQAQNLVSLSLRMMRVYPPPGGKVTCSRVKSLCLDRIRGQDCLIFSFLDNLEKLTLAYIFDFEMRHDIFSQSFKGVVNLTIDHGYYPDGVEISSSLLMYITLLRVDTPRLKFDVPNIRRFKFSGHYYPSKLPTLSFATVPTELESDVSLHIQGICSTYLWCYRLRRFMRKLNMSKVSLALQFDPNVSYRYGGELKGKPGPVVENLKLLNPLPYSALSDIFACVLWSFRPKVITQYWFPTSCITPDGYLGASNQCIKLMSKGLIQGRINCSADDEISFDNHDIEGVNVECSDEPLAEWFPMPWKRISDTEISNSKNEAGFELEWHRK